MLMTFVKNIFTMISNLMVKATFENYDDWKKNAFDTDSKRRSKVCDEQKTVVSKIDDKNAIILMFGFDLDKMKDFMTDQSMLKREAEFNVEHEIYTFSPIF